MRACASSSGSSAGNTPIPSGASPAKISPLARATSCSEPSRPRWAAPTLVTTPTWGRAISHRKAISPSPRIAISSTQTFSNPLDSSTVSGSPTSVLRLPAVRNTSPEPAGPVARTSSAAAVSSFVVVLPFEPVMPTTCPEKRSRTARARSASAVLVSATPSTGTPSQPVGRPRSRATTTAAAPAATAEPQCRKPSVRSPGSAKNSRPRAAARLSLAAPR